MATYFVRTGGSDGANGLSDQTAWATVAKVNGSTFSPGDRILFRRGDTWREQLINPSSGVIGNPIIYGNYGNNVALPILNGADVLSSWTLDAGNVWKHTLATQPQIVMFAGVLGLPVASKPAIDLPLEWFWTAGELFVFATSNPTSFYGTMEAAVRPTLAEGMFDFNGKSWVTIDGIATRHSNGVGIKNYAAGSGQGGRTVQNCNVAYCADGGIAIYGDNFFHGPTLIAYNEVSFANLRGAMDGSGSLEAITIMKGDGFDISYNTVHHCAEEGIDSHGESKNGRVHHNVVHTQIGSLQFRPAIYGDGGTNVEIDHNVAFGYTNNLCKGLQLNCENALHSSNNMRYHHNIVYNCQTGMEITNSGGGTGHANVKVYHNTFYKCSQYGVLFNSDILNSLAGVNEMKNNIFDTSVTNDINDFSTGNYGIANFAIDKNFFVTGNPSESQGTNPVTAASPLFKNGAGANFNLQLTSPCRNAGVVIAGINNDYWNTAPDLGALEFTDGVGGGGGMMLHGGGGGQSSGRPAATTHENQALFREMLKFITPSGKVVPR